MPRSSTLAETECAAPVNRRPPMSERLSTQQSSWLRPKNAVFAAVAAMTLYVLYHNERFLIEPENPIWKHYIEIACWLVPHAVAGTCALVLAPLQFSERLRKRYTRAHHIVGRLYVIGTLVLAPLRVPGAVHVVRRVRQQLPRHPAEPGRTGSVARTRGDAGVFRPVSTASSCAAEKHVDLV